MKKQNKKLLKIVSTVITTGLLFLNFINSASANFVFYNADTGRTTFSNNIETPNIDMPLANDWRYIRNGLTNGGLRLGTGNGSGTYTNGIEISSGANYIKLNHNTTVTNGDLTIDDGVDETTNTTASSKKLIFDSVVSGSGPYDHKAQMFIVPINWDTAYLNFQIDGDTKMVLGANGNVGVGTTNPGTYKLNVQGGQINASGGLCMNGVCQTAWNQIGTANLMNNSGRFTNLNGWTSNGSTISVDSTVTYGGYNTMKLVGASGASNNTIMRLKANTTYTISALVKGSSSLAGGSDTHLHVQSWTDENTSNVHQETSVKYDQDITTSWKVVYQTFTTPASANATYSRIYIYPLAAGYTLNVAYVKLEQGNMYSDWTIPTDEISTGASISGTANYLTKFTGSNAVGNSTVYNNGSAVGIGTTNPGYALDVVGGIRSSSAVFAAGTSGFYSSTYAVGARNPIWRFANADGYGLSYFQGTAGINGSDTIGFHFGTATATGSLLQINNNATITTSGKVGIGTTNASYPLDIYINSSVSNYSPIYSGIASFYRDGVIGQNLSVTNSGGSGPPGSVFGTYSEAIGSGSYTDAVGVFGRSSGTYVNWGLAGYGVSNSLYSSKAGGLTVGASYTGTGSAVAYGAYIDTVNSSSANTSSNAYGIYINSITASGGKPFALYSNTSAPSYFSGSVGVGTTNPLVKLQVTGGKAYIDSNSYGGTGAISLAVGDTDTGLNSVGDGQLDIWSNYVNTISIRSGSVGISTTNPGYNLDVNGTASFKTIDKIGPVSNNPERGAWNPIWSAVASGRALYADEEFSTGANSVGVYNNSGGSGVTHYWEAGDGSQPNTSGKVIRIVNNGAATSPGYGGFVQSYTCRRNATIVQRFRAKLPAGYSLNNAENSMGTNYTFYWLTSTAGTGKWEEYIRVTHCGNTGTFQDGGHVFVTGPGSSFTWYLASANAYEADSAPGIFSGKVGVGIANPGYKLEVAGDVGATAFTYTSDRSLKKNIETIKNPLNKVLNLRGVTFDWKADGKSSVGLIAQEVEKVFPELVTESNGIKSVQYGNLVAPLIEAVKEQQRKINNLEARINILENNK